MSNLKSSTLPDGWAWSTIGELVKVATGATPKRSNSAFWANGKIPWVTSAVVNQSFVDEPSEYITEEAIAKSNAKVFPIGTLLVAMYGEGKTRGKVTELRIDAATNQALAALLFDEHNHALRPYIKAFFEKNYQDIRQLSSGGVQPNLNLSIVKSTRIPIAPLAEQKRIVAEIETQFARLDQVVVSLERLRVKLKQYRASVLKAACEGRLVAQDPNDEPAEVLLARILAERRRRWEEQAWQKEIAKAQQKAAKAARKANGKPLKRGEKLADSEWRDLGEGIYGRYLPKNEKWKEKYKEPKGVETAVLPELPSGWTWVRAEQICDFITKGTTPKASKLFSGNGEVPFLKVYNLTLDGSLDFSVNPTFVSKTTHEGELARSKVFPNDVLMNIVGPPLGKVSIVPQSYPEWNMNQAMVVYRPIIDVDNKFLSHLLMCETILTWATRRAKATAGQFNLTLEICRNLPLPLPPLSEQKEIAKKVEETLSVVSVLEQTIEANLKRAARLRQAILKKAFSGQLVPQDPDDERTAVLLQRIQSDG